MYLWKKKKKNIYMNVIHLIHQICLFMYIKTLI